MKLYRANRDQANLNKTAKDRQKKEDKIMAMKIQARLPEPEELKQKYPMSADMKKSKKNGMERFRMYSPGIPINFSLSWTMLRR